MSPRALGQVQTRRDFVLEVADRLHEDHCPSNITPGIGICRCPDFHHYVAEVEAACCGPVPQPKANGGRYFAPRSWAWCETEQALDSPGARQEFELALDGMAAGDLAWALSCLMQADHLADLRDGAALEQWQVTMPRGGWVA